MLTLTTVLSSQLIMWTIEWMLSYAVCQFLVYIEYHCFRHYIEGFVDGWFQCDGNVPCVQCKGANHKPGSRWYGKPCFRRHFQGRVERPLQTESHVQKNERSPMGVAIKTLPQSHAIACQHPSLAIPQAIQLNKPSHIDALRHSALNKSTNPLNFYRYGISIAQAPLPTGDFTSLLTVPIDVLNSSTLTTQRKIYRPLFSFLAQKLHKISFSPFLTPAWLCWLNCKYFVSRADKRTPCRRSLPSFETFVSGKHLFQFSDGS